MSIPDYQSCMLPLLKTVGDGVEHSMRSVAEALADEFQLTAEERVEQLPSGRAKLFYNRVAWAKFYLKKAGLLDAPKYGHIQVSQKGMQILLENPAALTSKYLDQISDTDESGDEFDSKPVSNSKDIPLASNRTPEEVLELAHESIRAELGQELLETILSCSPAFFENLVVDLLLKMGYGGSRKDAGERIGQSGDGGIDGIIKEDRLGLDVIYIQAKRWQGSVGRPEIQKFVGALQGQRARKGVFITTSTYTAEAKAYAENIDTKVVLIDGKRLAGLMIDFDVGVSVAASYVVKKIDSDYFEEN
jgi:restriction system protein